MLDSLNFNHHVCLIQVSDRTKLLVFNEFLRRVGKILMARDLRFHCLGASDRGAPVRGMSVNGASQNDPGWRKATTVSSCMADLLSSDNCRLHQRQGTPP
jgi:hypothetical protein